MTKENDGNAKYDSRWKTAQVNGIALGYKLSGSGGRTIVLIHGWPQSGYAWRKVEPLLAERYTVLTVDMRGVGSSDAPVSGYDKATLAADIHALAKLLTPGAVYLVGHDLGATVAYAFARQFPSDTAGVAVVDIPLPGVGGWETATSSYPAWHFGFHQNVDNGIGVAEELVHGKQKFYFRSFVDRFAGHPEAITDEDLDIYAAAYGTEHRLRAGFEMYRAFPQDIADNQVDRGPLPVPVLLAFGEFSNAPLLDLVADGLKAAGVSDVRTSVIEDSGHFPAEERPDQLATLIARFVDSASAE
jgi:pimeloyl-ACP methyl ester carboxylesterase